MLHSQKQNPRERLFRSQGQPAFQSNPEKRNRFKTLSQNIERKTHQGLTERTKQMLNSGAFYLTVGESMQETHENNGG